jgi:hypothetical protein
VTSKSSMSSITNYAKGVTCCTKKCHKMEHIFSVIVGRVHIWTMTNEMDSCIERERCLGLFHKN